VSTRVLVAKWLSLALSSVVITAATLALSLTFGIGLTVRAGPTGSWG
jgi:hypothetical protein